MIKALNRDMNRSRDVKGPELKRPHDKEIDMGGKLEVPGLEDYADTGTLSKHDLSDLHHGDHEVPLRATAEQHVVVPAPMGRDNAMGHYKPVTAKGSTRDQAHFGDHSGGQYPEESKSVGKKPAGMAEPKGLGRSKVKMMEYAAKKKGY